MLKTVSLFLILSSSAWASDSFTQVDSKCATPANSAGISDPFDPSLSFASGPNEGKCVNTSERRSATPLTKVEQAYYRISVPKGSLSFANFSHQHRHYIAVVDPKGIEDVIYHIEYFPAVVPAAHNQIRIKMKPGSEVLLYSQELNARGRPLSVGVVDKLREIVFSAEAIGPAGEDYDLVQGLKNHFVQTYRFVSMADKFEWMVTRQHHQVRQLSLNMTPEQKADFLKKALALSAEEKMSAPYNTLFNSCVTQAFKVLDMTIHYNTVQSIGVGVGAVLLDQTNPVEAVAGLTVRGLVKTDGSSELPELDKDQELLQELKQGY